MSNRKGEFTRDIDQVLLNKLKSDTVFRCKLLEDIAKRNVFVALRNNRMDFYFRGGKLFSFGEKGLSTHIKYATTPEDNTKNYVTEADFSEICKGLTKSFKKDYDKIKDNCGLYSKGSEATGVSYLWEKGSFVNASEDIIVLDIEISLKSAEDIGRNQDRIDVLLYSNRGKALKFIEAKLYTNNEIRSKTEPAIISQIERYNNQIKTKESEILAEYKKYIKIMNELFSLEIEEPIKVLPGAGLYIFGFDDDQKNGNLKNIEQKLDEKHIKYYSLGNPSNIKIKALWSAVTKL
jgi:hypothetical protein